MSIRALRPNLLLDAVLLVVFALGLLVMAYPTLANGTWWGYDAWAYWSVDQAHPYAQDMNVHGAFLYAPAIAQLLAPFQLIPWPLFLVGWTMALGMLLAWMCRGYAALVFLVPFVAIEVLAGNIHLVLAAAVVAGFRWPVTWSFVILTKVTPGVGLLWFVARREWRSVAIPLVVTAIVVGLSVLIAPDRWTEWLDRLRASAAQPATWPATLVPSLGVRVVLAGAIAVVSGMAGWRWPVIVSVMLALPNPAFISPALLVGLVPLAMLDRRDPLPTRWPRLASRRRRPIPVAARPIDQGP